MKESNLVTALYKHLGELVVNTDSGLTLNDAHGDSLFEYVEALPYLLDQLGFRPPTHLAEDGKISEGYEDV